MKLERIGTVVTLMPEASETLTWYFDHEDDAESATNLATVVASHAVAEIDNAAYNRGFSDGQKAAIEAQQMVAEKLGLPG